MGKTSLLRHCAKEGRQFISLDDLSTRVRARQDPALFCREIQAPVLIDEIQYAPELLSALKVIADADPTRPGAVWLTGSQNFSVMKGVQESLAGRVGIVNLLGLSDGEKKIQRTPQSVFESILETGFPKLRGVGEDEGRSLYLSSYLQTYVERDVCELLGIQKRREFEVFLKLCALRTAQVVNYDDLASNAGVSPSTAKEWLSLLEDSFLVKLVHPHHGNKSKRLIKSPKLYFLDAGLAAYLAGWHDTEMARLGPMSGALLETHVCSEIMKFHANRAQPAQIHFWRTRDGEEIDFLVESGGRVTPLEVKQGAPNARKLPALQKIREANWENGIVLSLALDHPPQQIDENWRACALDVEYAMEMGKRGAVLARR